jgi:hypothetical protein
MEDVSKNRRSPVLPSSSHSNDGSSAPCHLKHQYSARVTPVKILIAAVPGASKVYTDIRCVNRCCSTLIMCELSRGVANKIFDVF